MDFVLCAAATDHQSGATHGTPVISSQSTARTVLPAWTLLLQVGENTSLCRHKQGTSRNPEGLQTGPPWVLFPSCPLSQDRTNTRSYLFGTATFLRVET